MPGIPEENYWFRRHEAAYEWAGPYAADRRVLEVGCGEGYGTAMLASSAATVLGVDYDAAAISHATGRYPQACFVRANLAALPAASGSWDLVATLQVIEHVWNHPEFVGECRRVLAPGGRLLVTTPNRLTFSPGQDTPLNPFHTVEFTGAELITLLQAGGFEIELLAGLHAGPRLVDLDATYGGSFVDAQIGRPPAEWPDALRADVRSVTTADFEIVEDGVRPVDASLDLVVLARPA